MAITDPHVLPADLVIVAVAELATDVRARLDCDDDAFAVTRPRSRSLAKIVDHHAGRLLQRFDRPKRIVDAILEFSAERGVDPEQLLSEAYPMLHRFVHAGLLVEEGSEGATRILPGRDVGDAIGDWTVTRCVQVLEDVEVYQVHSAGHRRAAMKIARHDSDRLRAALDHEADILTHLQGVVSPRILDVGRHNGCAYLAMDWCAGVDAMTAADEWRSPGYADGRARLLTLCVKVAEAYARLHQADVVHGDVHERNLLVDAEGLVRILDFGLAKRLSGLHAERPVPRGGVGMYFEPEFATAEGRGAPPVSPAGEQYSLAALLYYLFCGKPYLSFALSREEAMRQIATVPPLPFESQGVAPFPELERVLGKALRKSPAERYGSVGLLAAELRALESAGTRGAPIASRKHGQEARALVDATLARLRVRRASFDPSRMAAPVSNVNFGAAGVAHAIYRMALARDDANLLSLADVWATRAADQLGHPRAFYNPAMGLTRTTVGPTSLYHTESGVHLVRALIARAMGDYVSLDASVSAYIDASRRHGSSIDLTLGRAGILLGCALLLESLPSDAIAGPEALMAHGDQIETALWRKVHRYPAVGTRGTPLNLGVAHGWAGVLFAILRWRLATGRPVGAEVQARLHELAQNAEPAGRGMRWPWFIEGAHAARDRGYMSGWCNGSAGFVHLWVLAHRAFRESSLLDLALGAAWNAWEDEDQESTDLCCGLAGRAYALLSMYRTTGDRDWVTRAKILTSRALEMERDALAAGIDPTLSLYKGALGLVVLVADLDRPETARLPLFESEGWPMLRSLSMREN